MGWGKRQYEFLQHCHFCVNFHVVDNRMAAYGMQERGTRSIFARCSNLGAVYILCGALLSLLTPACRSPFSTREAESPNLKRSEWFPPTSPSVVLANVRNAVQSKNVTNYLKCMADSSTTHREFAFIADQSVANNNPGFFDKWNLESEGNFIRQIFSVVPEDSVSKLVLETLSENSYPDSALFVQNYTLQIEHTLGPAYPRKAEGQVELLMIAVQQTGYWYIQRWTDTGFNEIASWSNLKVLFGK